MFFQKLCTENSFFSWWHLVSFVNGTVYKNNVLLDKEIFQWNCCASNWTFQYKTLWSASWFRKFSKIMKQTSRSVKVVAIDESKFGKRKFKYLIMVHILWVFGFLVALNVEVSPPPKAFLHYSSRSSSASPLTNGSFCNALKFCPDGCWKAYSTLHDKGYVHKTVKHNKEFVLIWEHIPTELYDTIRYDRRD